MNANARGSTVSLRLTAVATPLAVLVWTVMVWAAADMTTCGGDGGSPYAAAGSSRAAYCDGAYGALSIAAVLAAPALAAAGGLLLWRRGNWRAFWLITVVAGLVACVPAIVGESLYG